MGALLAVFYVLEQIDHAKVQRHHKNDPGPGVNIFGIHNFLFIAVIIVAVFQPGFAELIDARRFLRILVCREVIMILAAGTSRLLTGQLIYQRNSFSYGPIREVAVLFFGLFSTMVPALQWLGENAARMAPRTPGQYYFTTGSLSAMLDNAPTYLAFFELELGKVPREQVSAALADQRTNHRLLGIALGAVLFGALTYIGNGPNFMVKSIADAAGAPSPGFVKFIWRYSLPILGPLYLLVWWIFLR
jgi:Na+/H+ antiporter NhaD/arsenite permease-like protein